MNWKQHSIEANELLVLQLLIELRIFLNEAKYSTLRKHVDTLFSKI